MICLNGGTTIQDDFTPAAKNLSWSFVTKSASDYWGESISMVVMGITSF